MDQLLLQFLSSVVTAVIASFVAVKLSIRQFHTTRWWEKKAEAYAAYIEAAAEVLSFYRLREYNLLKGRRPKGPDVENSRTRALAAYNRLLIGAGTGPFLVSSGAAQAIEKLRKITFDPPDDILEEVRTGIQAYEECLSVLRNCARDELQPDRSIVEAIEDWMDRFDVREQERRREA